MFKIDPHSVQEADSELYYRVIQFDELNRSRQVPKLANHLEYPKKQEVHDAKLILLKINAQSFPEADSEVYYRVRHSASI